MANSKTSGAARTGTRPLDRAGRSVPRWQKYSDAGLALSVLALEVAGLVSRHVNETGEWSLSMLGDVPPSTYLLLAASSIALLWRRSQPLLVLAVTLAASLIWDVIDLADGPSLAIIVSLFGLGRYVDRNRHSFLGLGIAALIVAFDDLLIEQEDLSVVGLSLAVVVVPWYVGRRIKGRKEHLDLLVERAEFLEKEQQAEADRAVEEERTRIARELHDVVAHRVSMITVQAGAAQTVAASEPEKAVRAMEAIENEGREALRELRQVLGLLRSERSGNGVGPVHGLAEIPALVGEMAETGVEVSLFTHGLVDDLPTRVNLGSYRIVQEALTNVLKHAGPNPLVEVRLSVDQDVLTIEVSDRGVGSTILPSSGQGLLGMRERTALLGGTFEAGPRLGGGFRVMARIPVDRSPS